MLRWLGGGQLAVVVLNLGDRADLRSFDAVNDFLGGARQAKLDFSLNALRCFRTSGRFAAPGTDLLAQVPIVLPSCQVAAIVCCGALLLRCKVFLVVAVVHADLELMSHFLAADP